MRVHFLRGTALGGIGNDAYPGDERDLPEWQALQYIRAGRARLASPEGEPQKTIPPASVQAGGSNTQAPAPAGATQPRSTTRKAK